MSSPWLDNTPLLFPPLSAELEVEVAVAGGGLCGLAAALALARAGRSVALVERGSIGGGLTGRSLGILAAGGGRHLARDVRELGAAKALALRRLAREGLAVTADACAGGVDAAWAPCGVTLLALSPREWADAQESARRLADEGVAVRTLDRDEARAAAGSRLWSGAYVDPEAAAVDPARLARGLARLAAAAGARVFEGTALAAFEEPAAGGVLLHTLRGRVRAGMLVLAVNAWLEELMPNMGDRLRPRRAQGLRYGAAGAAPEGLWITNHGHEAWRRDGGALLFGGCRETAAGEDVASEETSGKVQGAMERFAGKAFPGIAEVAVTHRWAGAAAGTCDGLPILGPPPGHPNVVLAVGYGELELAAALGLGKRTADQVLVGRSVDVEIFGARRFGI